MDQLSKEWIEARKGKITGSQVGAILGLSPFMTREDVMRSMVREYYGSEREFKGHAATEWGSHNEPGAGIEYVMETGNAITRCGFFTHPKHNWLGASPDGLIGDNGIIEIKCPYSQRDKIPPQFRALSDLPHYEAQMQIEMACAQKEYGVFFQWSPAGTSTEHVEFNAQMVNAMIKNLYLFYGRYLVEREQPQAQKYLEPKRKQLSRAAAELLIGEYDRLSAEIDEASDRKSEVLQEIVALSGEKDSVIFGHKLTKVTRKGSVDYGAIPELKGVDLELFRKDGSEFWRLS